MATDEQQTITELTTRFDEATKLEDVASRHRRERKELQARLQAMKKNAPKNNKKQRKEFLEEMARLELELEQRQQQELLHRCDNSVLVSNGNANDIMEAAATAAIDTPQPPHSGHSEADTDDQQPATQQRVSKAQKRRDRKAQAARVREDEIRAELLSAEQKPSAKAIELQLITAKLRERQLALHNISSDGDCLYNAVRHQLHQQGLPVQSVDVLRNETASYIRANKETLINYMTDPKTGNTLSDAQFADYCQAIVETHAWGGHIELKALSSILRVPIEVLQAEGAPTQLGVEEFGGAPLIICYHRHIYQLGEHYNSTAPLT